MRDHLKKIMKDLDDDQIETFLLWVWDQDIASEARDIYEDKDLQLERYLENSSDSCIECSFDNFMQAGIERSIFLYTKMREKTQKKLNETISKILF